MKRVFTAVIVICMMMTVSIAWSKIIHVPGDYDTIQEGIDAASDGDTVLVADGTYKGIGNKNLNFKGKNIIVTSENGAESTVIDCENDGRGFHLSGGQDSSAVISGFTITNGDADTHGGGIYCDNSSPTIANNIIEENRAPQLGGGIYCYNSSPVITNNIIKDNSSRDYGGGIFFKISSPVITNNIITDNSSGSYGGGISCVSSSGVVANNVITGNTAKYGGGICFAVSSLETTNNTITDNSANQGGGIYCRDSSPIVINTILWNDAPDEIYLNSSTITITYSDVKGSWAGEGNINADPLFVDPENGDYHLQPDSPCIDAGGPNSPKDPDGTIADMGALYYDQSGIPVPTILEKVSGDNQIGDAGTVLPEPLVVMLKDQNANPMAGVQVDFAVTQGDGSINPTSAFTNANGEASTELTLGQTAKYNKVTATVGSLSVIFNAIGGTQFVYVDDDNDTGIEDGSQEHPFNTIQEGIDAALDGDTVIVADGIYTGDGNKNLDFNGKNIIVTSENGAESTIIDCENDGRGFYFHSGETSEAVVSGFTIRNGYVTDEGGGIHCDNNSSPMITNNIIEGNTADHSGGGIGLYNSSPKIINNIITSNSSDYVGGGISCWDYCSPEITNNVIAGNTASNGGGIYCETSSSPAIINSTITANTGYGIYCYDNSSPVVVNTILWNETPDEIYLSGGSTITITYSDIKGGWTGEGNIDADPLFVDPESGDYHLQASSPCIDAGDPNSPKDPDGTIADMGALYYDQSGIPIPTTLEKVSGDNQIGFVGTTLPNPLVVRVLDQNGEPMEGITVNFESSGGATVNPTQATTNENGQAQTILTLGTLSGEYNVTVSVEGLEPVVFTATAIESEKPIIFSIHPNYGYIIGGTEITITGANFQDGATVTIGGRLAQDVTNPEETSAWLTSDHIDITDEAPENVQLLITLDEGVGPTTETITFSTSGISLAQVQVETTSLEVLRIIIQTAIDNRFGAGKITVSVSGSDTTARVTFTTVAIGADVRLSIEQQVGSDILFSEPMISSGLQIHATTPEGTIGPKAVVVTNPDGESATYPKGFVYLPLTGDVSGDGTISAYDAALILQFVVGIIDVFPADSPIAQAAQKYISGEVSIEELDRLLQKLGYPSIFKLLVIENQLLQNFPNPFNPETWIPFKLAQNASVTINIYDTKGQLIHNISLGTKQAGLYVTKDKSAYWNGTDSLGQKVASGIYYYTLQAGEFRATRKMVIMK